MSAAIASSSEVMVSLSRWFSTVDITAAYVLNDLRQETPMLQDVSRSETSALFVFFALLRELPYEHVFFVRRGAFRDDASRRDFDNTVLNDICY